MNIHLPHDILSQALQYTSKAVSTKPSIPILAHVLMTVEEGNLKLSATNLDMGIVMWIPGNVEADGSATVHAKYVADFVSATNASGETIHIEQDNANVSFTTANSNASFATIPPTDFPVLPKTQEKPLFRINAQEFIHSMNKVLFACSTDVSGGRIQQTGVLFDIQQETNEVHFVGVDGFRLSLRKSPVQEVNNEIEKEEIIVPARYIQEVVKMLSDYPQVEMLDIFMSESASQIIFKFDDIEASIRLLEGPFPQYKKILPDDYVFSFTVDRKELERSLKIVNSFARGNLGNKTLFDFDIETATVTLQAAVTDIGKGETSITVANTEGESDISSAYILRYLQDIANHVDGDQLIYETKSQLAATVFKDSDDPQFFHLIMPMRRE